MCEELKDGISMAKDVKSRETKDALEIGIKPIKLQTPIYFSPGNGINWTPKHHIAVG